MPNQLSRARIDNVDTSGLPAYLGVITPQRSEGIMKVVVKKWGNSASVRIPASVMAAARLSLDQAVDVREEEGRIIIEPILEDVVNLDDLLAGITDENRHEAVDWGAPRGQEIW